MILLPFKLSIEAGRNAFDLKEIMILSLSGKTERIGQKIDANENSYLIF